MFPRQQVGPQDVLIRIAKTAICGTDMHIFNWDSWAQKTIPVPMTVGHEYVGEIVELGRDVRALEIGERVSGEGHIVCGRCRNCRAGRQHLCRNTIGVGVNRPGAFAEYLAIPASNVYPIPADVPDDMAAILDPLGNAAHTALSFDLVGEDVLITGAGPIGIMAAAIATHVGARHVVITDVNDYRLKLAGLVGKVRPVNVTRETARRCDGRAARWSKASMSGWRCPGNPQAFKDMLGAMMHGGRIALLGIPPEETAIDWNEVIFKGVQIKGIYGREMFETWYKMTALLQGGLNLAPVLTHQFAVDDFQAGFETMNSGRSGKVILNWH